MLWAVAGRQLWSKVDGAAAWTPEHGLPEGQVDVISADSSNPRLWAAAADRIYLTEDGRAWRPFAQPLPEANTSIRGVSVSSDGSAMVATTDRGLLRSADGGRTWAVQEGVLPIHLEAGPLVRDPSDATTLYAGFALTPYAEQWRMAAEGGTMLGRLDWLSLAGAVAFLLVVAFAAMAALRGLARHYRRPPRRAISPGIGNSAR
jgi:hypothetical protein